MSRACRAHILPLYYTPNMWVTEIHLLIILLPFLSFLLAGCGGRQLGRFGAQQVVIFGRLVNLVGTLFLGLVYLFQPQSIHLKIGT